MCMSNEDFFSRSISKWVAEILGSYTVENNNLSSSNNFIVDCKLSGTWFIYKRKGHGSRKEPCWTLASTDNKLKHWSVSTTR